MSKLELFVLSLLCGGVIGTIAVASYLRMMGWL